MNNINRLNDMAQLQIYNLYLDTIIRVLLVIVLFLSIWYLIKRIKQM